MEYYILFKTQKGQLLGGVFCMSANELQEFICCFKVFGYILNPVFVQNQFHGN